jgi:F-type H+-transporting ATPase subunit b
MKKTVMALGMVVFSGASAHAAGGLISIDPFSLSIQIGNFILLIFLLNFILYRPIRKILIQRKEKIDGLEDRIGACADEAKEKDASYLQGIKEARSKGLKEKESLMQTATDEEKAIVDKINQKAQADLTEIREKIAKDTEAVRATLSKEIDDFANAIGQKILGRAV